MAKDFTPESRLQKGLKFLIFTEELMTAVIILAAIVFFCINANVLLIRYLYYSFAIVFLAVLVGAILSTIYLFPLHRKFRIAFLIILFSISFMIAEFLVFLPSLSYPTPKIFVCLNVALSCAVSIIVHYVVGLVFVKMIGSFQHSIKLKLNSFLRVFVPLSIFQVVISFLNEGDFSQSIELLVAALVMFSIAEILYLKFLLAVRDALQNSTVMIKQKIKKKT